MPYSPQANVAELMRLYGQEVKRIPELPDKATLFLRARLVFEEAMEFVHACGCDVVDGEIIEETAEDRPADLIEYADACGDILVVTYGALNAVGIQAAPLMQEIERSNRSKVWPDGTVHKREDGKVLKPDHYSPADIEAVISRCHSRSVLDIVQELYPEIEMAAAKGNDVWSWIAAEAFGVPYQFTYNMAEQAKAVGAVGHFAKVLLARRATKYIAGQYGNTVGPKAMARFLETTPAVTDELLDFFEERFPKLIPTRFKADPEENIA